MAEGHQTENRSGAAAREITAADICTSCGLCCSGAIFLNARIDQSEFALVERLGLKRWDNPDFPAIAFPCPALTNRCCTVYEDRPAICRKYRCEVLNNVDRGTLSPDRAIEIVTEAVALVHAANDGHPTDIAQQRTDHWADPDAWRSGPAETRGERMKRGLALYCLERFLDQYFRRPHQRQVTPTPTDG